MQPARPIYRVKEVVESISEVYIALATLSGTVVAPTQPYFLPLRARAAAAVLSFTRFFFPSRLGEQTLLCVSYHYWLLVRSPHPRVHPHACSQFFSTKKLGFCLKQR